MSTLANQIETYIKKLLSATDSGILEIRRNDLAETFMCVPSQINYVLSTRFSANQGYFVESRRGGGGFVRIIRLAVNNEKSISSMLETNGQKQVSRSAGEKLIDRLFEEDFLSKRESMLVKAMIEEKNIGVGEKADLIRGNLLNSVLLLLLRDDFM